MEGPTRIRRVCSSTLAVVAMLATVLVAASSAAAASEPTCFGRAATIVAVPGQPTVGTPGPDVIVGTAGPDVIRSLGGNDRICSGGGDDVIHAGSGRDRVKAGAGDDVVRGGKGKDLLRGGPGSDRLLGGKGTDTLRGNGGSDVLKGGSGPDVLAGGKGRDVLNGGKGGDVLNGGKGKDIVRGGAGEDVCNTGADNASACEPKPEPVAEEPGSNEPEAPPATPTPEPTPDPEPSPTPDTTPPGPTPTPEPTAPPEPTPTPTSPPEPTPTPTPTLTAEEELSAFIESDVLGVYGTSYPWLHTAWDFLGDNGTISVQDLPGNIAGQVGVSCSYSSASLGWCGNPAFRMDVNFTTNLSVIIHEMAHVLETSTGVLNDPGPMGMTQMYFAIEWGHLCDPSEVFADTLLHVTKPDAYMAYYLFACPDLAAVTNTPTVEAETVMISMLNGQDPAWFGETYANSTEVWTAVMTLPVIDRIRVITNLANEFGGYCSVSNTMITAFWGGTDTNPWADVGCES